MFDLDNILSYASANIQIIGVFIAIIGGLVATKLLNAKIERDTLVDKLDKIKKEIRFYQNRKITNEKELYKINKEDYISFIYDKVENEDFSIEDYEDYNLTLEQRKDIIREVKEWIKDALNIFSVKHYIEDIAIILKNNHIIEGTCKYMVYEDIGKNTRIRKTIGFGITDPTDIDYVTIHPSTFPDTLNERDLNVNIDKYNEFIEWKLMEKEDIESKLNAINNNLNSKNDVLLFIFITLFTIVIPQIILSIYPIFIKFTWLKYVFAIYSITTFVISMLLMLWYIFKLFLNINQK